MANCVESLAMAPSHPWFAVGRNDGSMCIYEMDSNAPRSIYQSNQMMVSGKIGQKSRAEDVQTFKLQLLEEKKLSQNSGKKMDSESDSIDSVLI